jgi:hypothetical protein
MAATTATNSASTSHSTAARPAEDLDRSRPRGSRSTLAGLYTHTAPLRRPALEQDRHPLTKTTDETMRYNQRVTTRVRAHYARAVDEVAFLLGHKDGTVTRTVYVREVADARRRAFRRSRMAAEYEGALGVCARSRARPRLSQSDGTLEWWRPDRRARSTCGRYQPLSSLPIGLA